MPSQNYSQVIARPTVCELLSTTFAFIVSLYDFKLKTFEIPGGGVVTVVMIDTTTLAPSMNQCCNEKGCAHSFTFCTSAIDGL